MESVINIEKIYWAFWQSSLAYNYENGYVCLFDCKIKSLTNDPDEIAFSDSFYFHGMFSLYKPFKMKNGKSGINKIKPVFEYSLTEPTYGISLNGFKRKGLFEVMDKFLKSNFLQPVPRQN